MKQIKKYLILAAMILTLSVCTVGCGDDEEETLIETPTVLETELLAPESDSSESQSQMETESTEESAEESTASEVKTISEEKAREVLVDAFGNTDEATGEKNVFTYDKIVTVDGVDYYTYEWSGEDGTYYCNAFVKTDGSDVLTGIYADGKWENCPLGQGVMDWANLLPRLRAQDDSLCALREGVFPGKAQEECATMHRWMGGRK